MYGRLVYILFLYMWYLRRTVYSLLTLLSGKAGTRFWSGQKVQSFLHQDASVQCAKKSAKAPFLMSKQTWLLGRVSQLGRRPAVVVDPDGNQV